VDAGYAYHDMMLGRLLELAGDDATVVVLSDHGFQSDHNRPTAIPSEPAGPAHEHREQGIFVACGPGIRRGGTVEGASLLDVTPTLLAILGLPVGADMDGRPLVEIFETPPAVETIPSWDEIPGEDGSHPPDRTVDPAESKEALEQLIALGYIERPPDDTDRAIAETERELDYNLARAYMDAGMHGEAIPLLARLYRDFPLEFRFGVQLANCLLAMRRLDDLDRVVEDLNRRWRNAREAAKERLDAIAEVARERKAQWEELDRIDREHEGEAGRPRLARRTMQGRPLLFSDAENHVIRKLRAVARGNPMTLDYLAAVSASTRHRHDEALAILDRTRLRRAASPDLQFHVGMIELEAGRAEEARTHFERALEIEPEHASALLGLCRVELRADRPGAALGYGERSVALRPHVAGAWFFVGRARLGTGDVDGAIAAFRTGIELNPNFMEAHQELAHLLSREKGDDEQAAIHRQASSDLALAAAQAKTAIAPIELPPLDEAAIAAALPELPEEHARAREGFLRCLGQAPGPVERADGASDEPIVVVSGLPRSGTSMMMQMMAAAGVPIVTDEERAADENNPKGYFEAESIKALPRRNDWVPASAGRCMKVVAPLVPYLPQGPRYRVIFMQRAIEEVLGSQDRMLERLDRSGAQLERESLAEIYAQQVQFALDVLELHGAEVLRIDHADAIDDPAAVAAKVAAFLGGDRDARAMAAVVDPSLHRERAIDS